MFSHEMTCRNSSLPIGKEASQKTFSVTNKTMYDRHEGNFVTK